MLRIPAFCDIMDDGKNNRSAAEIEHQGTDLGLDAAAAFPPQSGFAYQMLLYCMFLHDKRQGFLLEENVCLNGKNTGVPGFCVQS